MNPLLYYDSIYSLTSMKQHEDSHRQFLFEFISNEWNELLATSAGESLDGSNSFMHQMHRVSAGGRHYTPDEVNDHVGTMLTAVSFIYSFWSLLALPILITNCAFNNPKAGDTTSTALNFLFLMLAMHEGVQHRIVGEINEVFGEHKDLIIDHEKLSELKYVEMVIKETLRLFSPATGKSCSIYTPFKMIRSRADFDSQAFSGR